ncbi:MAG TPA: Rieske (2Fe-2S) protein [Blastocatellia bacterium]|jgi:NAD(P)H-dependent nitrite reductase small subunit
MSDFIKVANKSDVPSGKGIAVEINGRSIAVFNVDGEFYALDNICPHRGGPLDDGRVDCKNLTIQCPWHSWRFSLTSGVSPINPRAKVEKFDVQVEGEDVKISLE